MNEKNGEFDVVPEGYGDTIYTCQIHSEVRHPGPGACPLCGMRLESLSLEWQGEKGPNSELFAFTQKLWLGIGLSMPLLVLSTNGQISVYFEVTAVIVTLILLGQVMELHACKGTGKVIRALLGMATKTAQAIRLNGSGRRDRA